MKIIYSLLFLTFVTTPVHAELEFGRFYTTPKQRERLDQARSSEPQEITVVPLIETNLQQHSSADAAQTGSSSITLDGIVYRSDGKNTAWINRSSTNEGNLETQYTKVAEKDVGANEVKITLPDNETSIQMKVGQEYDVNSKQIHDHMKDPVISPSAAPADGTRPAR